MARFVLRRVASMIAVLFAISVLTFVIFQAIPNGDPALRLAGRLATAQQIEDVRKQWGFDRPIYVQYTKTMEKVFDGEVISYSQQQNVESEIWRDLPVTVSLALGAGVLFLAFGILFGLLSAVRAGRFTDRALTVLAMFGISMPAFFLAAVMEYYLSYKAGIFPIGGYVKLTSDPWGWFTHLILPWASLAILYVGIYSRVLRSNTLDTLGEDYVRTARAKGLSERQVLVRHVLRNSLVPIVTLWGLDLAALFGGAALLIETVFNLHGVGQYAAESIGRLDVPPILVITLLTAFFVVVFGALTDILYAVLDPRIRLS
jgi:peptide/nickel transport system permease protein